jgi:hypothetical protein
MLKDEILKLVSNGFDVSYKRISVGPLNRDIFHKLQYQVHWDRSNPYSELFNTPKEAVEVFIEKVKELKREKI